MKTPLEKAKESKTFCIYPWIHQYVGPPGDVKPCCTYTQDMQLGSLKENTLKEIWNNEETKKIRLQMLNGENPPGCNICTSRTHLGNTFRDSANLFFFDQKNYDLVNSTKEDGTVDEHKLQYIDVRWNNLCNLKCRTCGPRFSSSWLDDHAKLHDLSDEHRETFVFSGKTEEQALEEIIPHLPYVKSIYFAGGEPLMQEDHYKVLLELIRLGHTGSKYKPLIINYNSNFTQLKLGKYNILDLWPKFKEIQLNASIDGSHKKAEYWRKGSHWDVIVNNRIKLKEKCPKVTFHINYTVSWVTIFNMFELHKEWVEKDYLDINHLNVNLLEGPKFYCLKNIPHWKKLKIDAALTEHQKWLVDKQANMHTIREFIKIRKFMYSTDTNTNDFIFSPDFIKETQKLDQIRKENFWDIYPEHLDMKEYLNV